MQHGVPQALKRWATLMLWKVASSHLREVRMVLASQSALNGSQKYLKLEWIS
jgi:hypothetical protein